MYLVRAYNDLQEYAVSIIRVNSEDGGSMFQNIDVCLQNNTVRQLHKTTVWSLQSLHFVWEKMLEYQEYPLLKVHLI